MNSPNVFVSWGALEGMTMNLVAEEQQNFIYRMQEAELKPAATSFRRVETECVLCHSPGFRQLRAIFSTLT